MKARPLSALAVGALLLGLLAGCGDDLPSGAVAVVDGDVVSQQELLAAKRALAAESGAQAASNRQALKAIIYERWILRRARAEGLAPDGTPNGLEAAKGNDPARGFRRRMEASRALRKRLVHREAIRTNALGDAAIEQYRARHKDEAFPERRDLWLLAYPTKRQAVAARAAVVSGTSWRTLWANADHDVLGGSRPNFALLPSEAPPGLDRAVFHSQRGALRGPIGTADAWYVFEVTKITPGVESTPSLRKGAVKTTIERRLNRQLADSLREEYRGDTTCRPTLQVAECQTE